MTAKTNYFNASLTFIYPGGVIVLIVGMFRAHAHELYRADLWVFFLLLLIALSLALEAPYDTLVKMKIDEQGIEFSKPWKRFSLLGRQPWIPVPIFKIQVWETIPHDSWNELWLIRGYRGMHSLYFKDGHKAVFYARITHGGDYFDLIKNIYPKKAYKLFISAEEAGIDYREAKEVLEGRVM